MGVIDDVMVNAKAAIDDFGKKATDIADSSILAISANNIKNQLEKKYMELGKSYYENVNDGVHNADEIDDIMDEIKVLLEQLNAVREKRAELRKQKICPNCKRAVPRDSSFCNKCGAHLDN